MKNKLSNLKNNLKKTYQKRLKKFGVKFPTGKNLNKLLCLYENIGKAVSQNEIFDWHEKNNLPKYDRQARHLVNKGWDIRTGNSRSTKMKVEKNLNYDQLILFSVDSPSSLFIEENQRRKILLSVGQWEDLLNLYKDRGCAVCGTKENSYDRGHLDHEKPTSIKNIVPMCSSCNNWAQRYNLKFKKYDKLIVRPIFLKE